MPLRGYPERIYLAQRVAVIQRLVAFAHVPRVEAEDWVSQWEHRARIAGIRRASHGYWACGLRWIATERNPERVPG